VIKGIVFRIESKDYYVLPTDGDQIIRCSLRGKFKNEFKLKKDKLFHTDIAVIGDSIEYDMNADGTGVIHKIDKRKNYLSRKAPKIRGAGFRGERLEQIIAANIDNLLIFSSILEPVFNNKVLDRLIIMGETAHIPLSIIINKADLDENEAVKEWKELYDSIGYKVFITSTFSNQGLDDLRKSLQGKKNLFFGHSGVGKSSLLNKLFPELELKVGKISSFTEKGTHTTVTSIMIQVDADTFVIDTPGIREIEPFGIRKEDLGHYFIEFSDFINECKFNTCIHYHEPGCAVIDAVEKGAISLQRYESYLRILETIEEDINF
jgi:ribosome biogenesis GTPase